MQSIGELAVLLGFVTLLLTLYTMVARSAGIFPSKQHFWRNTLISAGLSYSLSAGLFLFWHVPLVAAFIVATIVPFIVGNFDGSEREQAHEEVEEREGEEGELVAALEKDGNEISDLPVAEG